MKYEGKIYGKVNGKLIELDFPKDLLEFKDQLLSKLENLRDAAKSQSEDFESRSMTTSYFASSAMETAYQVVIGYVNDTIPKGNRQ